MIGVILYGPPASGKDTISAALTHIDPRFRTVRKLKAGSGRTTGYKIVDHDIIESLKSAGRIALEHSRYGNIYAIDRKDVERLEEEGLVPIIHVGRIVDLRTVLDNLGPDWLPVLLWCSRNTTEQRSKERGDTDTSERLLTWDATRIDLDADIDELFKLGLRTDLTTGPDLLSRRIVGNFNEGCADFESVQNLISEIRS